MKTALLKLKWSPSSSALTPFSTLLNDEQVQYPTSPKWNMDCVRLGALPFRSVRPYFFSEERSRCRVGYLKGPPLDPTPLVPHQTLNHPILFAGFRIPKATQTLTVHHHLHSPARCQGCALGCHFERPKNLKQLCIWDERTGAPLAIETLLEYNIIDTISWPSKLKSYQKKGSFTGSYHFKKTFLALGKLPRVTLILSRPLLETVHLRRRQ